MRLALACLALVALFVTACGDDGEPAPAASPTAGATAVEPSPTGENDLGRSLAFREFAAEIQAALDAGDLSFFRDRARTEEVVCAAEDLEGLGGPACESEGQRFEGFTLNRWRSEGNIVPVEDALANVELLAQSSLPEASDDFGDGAPRVYAIEITPGTPDAILTALIERPPDFAEGGPVRVSLVTSWEPAGDGWELVSMIYAPVLGEEFLVPCVAAANFVGEAWERYPDPDAPNVEQPCPFTGQDIG